MGSKRRIASSASSASRFQTDPLWGRSDSRFVASRAHSVFQTDPLWGRSGHHPRPGHAGHVSDGPLVGSKRHCRRYRRLQAGAFQTDPLWGRSRLRDVRTVKELPVSDGPLVGSKQFVIVEAVFCFGVSDGPLVGSKRALGSRRPDAHGSFRRTPCGVEAAAPVDHAEQSDRFQTDPLWGRSDSDAPTGLAEVVVSDGPLVGSKPLAEATSLRRSKCFRRTPCGVEAGLTPFSARRCRCFRRTPCGVEARSNSPMDLQKTVSDGPLVGSKPHHAGLLGLDGDGFRRTPCGVEAPRRRLRPSAWCRVSDGPLVGSKPAAQSRILPSPSEFQTDPLWGRSWYVLHILDYLRRVSDGPLVGSKPLRA